MLRKLSACFFAAVILALPAGAQKISVAPFKTTCDSLSARLQRRTGVKTVLRLKSVSAKGSNLDFRFSETLSDIPWKRSDVRWFTNQLKELLPEGQKGKGIGEIYAKDLPLDELVTAPLGHDGTPSGSKFLTKQPHATPLVKRVGEPTYSKGMSGRHIALWQSHGRYYEAKTRRWEWQRAQVFMTVEDMYTQSFVLPFLIPMLENAGAYVMTPRERDIQRHEVITDNDPAFTGERSGYTRKAGLYRETGHWTDAGAGFADSKRVYTGDDNPFTMGTARQTPCVGTGERVSEAIWIPEIPQRGEYAVYVSYKTLPESTTAAHYTVRHMGGSTEFIVNQRMGGGTWIYLGTFLFDKGDNASVTLDNGTPEGYRHHPRSIVTADAVKIGGGMGKIARGQADEDPSAFVTSGLPSYTEGALYWMQWAGVDTTVTRRFEDDYTNDYADRGAWVSMMAGGSRVNPDEPGKGIPFDLSLAFHSDAGTTPNDSIVGTLAIYTLKCDGKRELPNGEDRLCSREYADLVQSQVVQDIRAGFEPLWSRRQLWDRSYSESRTTSVPGMILEILAHQNFADMKYGLDPTFRFTVSRAVYKGMLKFLSNRYGVPYRVQPLPVNSFHVTLAEAGPGSLRARLGWKATKDSLETTATPEGFILYTRVDDGAFDQGKVLSTNREGEWYFAEAPIEPGHVYSFKLVAFNAGGRSFPSEILCAGVPRGKDPFNNNILIINNFTRLSPPTWFDTPSYAGFQPERERGSAFGIELPYIGEMYEYRRDVPWIDDDNPGFGASYSDEAGRQFAGNTFDYPSVHGKALLAEGYPFCSTSADAFCSRMEIWDGIWAADLVCGKQVTVPRGRGALPDRYAVFPASLQAAVKAFTDRGGNMLVSGANIGTDAWDKVYPITVNAAEQKRAQGFIQSVLGYKWLTGHASRLARIQPLTCSMIQTEALPEEFSYHRFPNETCYNVEAPDGLVPADGAEAATFLRYSDTRISAGVCFQGNGYKAVSLGFPIEVLNKEEDIRTLLHTVFAYFQKPSPKKKK